MAPWWIASRIEATLTRQYVVQQLLPEEIQRLDQPVGFGAEDLTERTYWDSIQHGAKRLFMILVDIGIPDQIFGIIDDGWDDAELPLAPEDVERLHLTAVKDDRVDRKFHQRQFLYLIRTVDRGEHITYSSNEVVPLDVVERSSSLPNKSQLTDRVKLPNVSNTVFTRQRYPLGDGPGAIPHQGFVDLIASIRGLRNDHIVSYWGSYTHQASGYILLVPASDFNLKSFLATTPSSFKVLAKKHRRELVMNWILCLADTMCFLHNKGRSHCYIKPSTILFNNRNHVFFTDSTKLNPEAFVGGADKSSFDREWYDYAAPEQWFRPAAPSSPPNRKVAMPTYSMSPEQSNFNNQRGLEGGSSPTAMMQTPNPQLNPQQADIFSLGCILLELLSYLVKRSTSKFATFRSAKHKTAGRGGAVLDTSFHKNLGQVEAWMSGVAKDASKKISDPDGGQVFQGITPMLHIVAGMLSANPYDRPTAFEVQQGVYQILIDQCDIHEPHCVHEYSMGLQHSLSRMRIQDSPGPPGTTRMGPQQMSNRGGGYAAPRTARPGRSNSSGGYSEASGTSSSNTTASSERDADVTLASARGMPVPQRARAPGTWPVNSAYMDSSGNQSSLYASAR